jgi:hypothetical protein
MNYRFVIRDPEGRRPCIVEMPLDGDDVAVELARGSSEQRPAKSGRTTDSSKLRSPRAGHGPTISISLTGHVYTDEGRAVARALTMDRRAKNRTIAEPRQIDTWRVGHANGWVAIQVGFEGAPVFLLQPAQAIKLGVALIDEARNRVPSREGGPGTRREPSSTQSASLAEALTFSREFRQQSKD